MRRLPFTIALCLLLIAAWPAMAAAVTAEEALPLPNAWPAPFADQVVAPEYVDLWTVSLAAGQQIIVNMTPVTRYEEIGVCLWAPGTTDFSYPFGSSLRRDMRYSRGAASYRYVVPAGAGGVYYIEVWGNEFALPTDGSYRMWVSVQSPSKTAVRITPPAVVAQARLWKDYTAWGTLRPLHYAGLESVRVEWQKYRGGRWIMDSTERVENVNFYNGRTRYTRFKVEYSFYGSGSGTMRWRVRAVHLADALHPKKVSDWRYFTVSN